MLSGCLLRYLSGKQSAWAVLYSHMWPIWFYHIFPHYLINGAISWKKLVNPKWVFWFSLQILSEIFLSLRNVQWHIVINVHLYVKHFVLRSGCKGNQPFSPDFRKKFNMKFHETFSTGRLVIPCGRTDGWTGGRTEGHDEPNSCFSGFCLSA